MPRTKSSAEPTATLSISAFPTVPLSELKRLRLFRGVSIPALALLEGKVRQVFVPGGETIMELVQSDLVFRYFFFIVRGQVKALGLDEDARLRPLNFLRKGDFFVDKSFHWRSQVATKMVALTDVELMVLPKDELKHVARVHPPLQERLRVLSEKIDYRNRIYSEDKYARSVLEFLIEKELTQASRVKITQLDKCIECNTCYISCETRFGFQRLERGYARFGILDFSKSCLTCFYPACIPACPVGAILFNVRKGEVEILDTCIGCAACARACQYDAIRMFKVVPGDSRFARFLAPGKKIKPKFIADKCEHCDGYAEMACVTNCPTGAIIEVEAGDLLENPRIFGTGEGVRKPLPSLTKRPRFERLLQGFYAVFGLLLATWLTMEVYALNRAPSLSLLLSLQTKGFIPARFQLTFSRGSDFCFLLGNVGFTLLFLGMAYPLRKGIPRLFKHLGKQPAWLDLHNFCGALATTFIVYHTGFYFPLQPSTFALFGLLLVAVSGVFGRFLYQMIPRGVAGTELKMRDIEEEDAAITAKLDALFEGSTQHRQAINRIVASLTAEAAAHPTVRSMIRSVFRTWTRLLTFRLRLPMELRVKQSQTGPLLELLHDKIRLKRNVAFLGLSSRLFRAWRYVHRPVAYATVSIALGHAIYNLIFFSRH
ncbi:MAG: 4Fe-4S dicluster domain-containing protein [Pseudomonadota bacterium]